MHSVNIVSVEKAENGWIVVVADLTDLPDVGLEVEGERMPLEDQDAHMILLQQEAIQDRMEVYGLKDPKDALAAIVREHALRLSSLQPRSEEMADQLGGADDRIKVKFAGDES